MEGYLPIPYPPWSCKPDSVLWVVMVVIQSTVWWHLWAEDVYPSAKHMQSCRHPLPIHITWSLHPSLVETLVDVHGRSHNFPLIHPREVLLAWCWVVARPLSSCSVISLSLPMGVGLTGWGWYICPMHGGHPHRRGCQFLTWWEVSCSGGCMTCHIGPSLHTRRCLLQSDAPPHEVHPPTYL